MSHSFLNSVFLLYFKQNLKATKDIINVFDLISFFEASSQILPPLRNFTKLHIRYLWYSPQVCIFSFLYLVAQCPDTGAPRGNCCAVNLSTVCRTPRGTWPRGWGWLDPSGPVCPHHWPPSATDCREKRMSLRKGHFNNFIENEKKKIKIACVWKQSTFISSICSSWKNSAAFYDWLDSVLRQIGKLKYTLKTILITEKIKLVMLNISLMIKRKIEHDKIN